MTGTPVMLKFLLFLSHWLSLCIGKMLSSIVSLPKIVPLISFFDRKRNFIRREEDSTKEDKTSFTKTHK